jgi:hypothetical protein
MHYCKTTKGLKGFNVLLELIHFTRRYKTSKEKFNVLRKLWILMHLHYKFKHSQYDMQNEIKGMKCILNSYEKKECKPQTQSQP